MSSKFLAFKYEQQTKFPHFFVYLKTKRYEMNGNCSLSSFFTNPWALPGLETHWSFFSRYFMLIIY